MDTLLSPLLRLFARWSWNIKFAVVGVLAIVVMATLVILGSRAELTLLASTRAEQRGLEVFSPALDALLLLQQHRGTAAGALGGDATMKAALAKRSEETEAAFGRLEAAVAASTPAWQLATPLNELRAQWNALRSNGMSLSGPDNFRAHTRLIEATIDYIGLIGDRSELVLDPVADTYHPIIVVVQIVPQLAERLGRLRGTGNGILAQHAIDDAQRNAVSELVGGLRLSWTQMRMALGRVHLYDGKQYIDTAPLVQSLDGRIEEATRLVRDEVLSGKLEIAPADYFAVYSKTIAAVVDGTRDTLVPSIRRSLEARAAEVRVRLILTVLLSAGASLLLVLCLLVLHRGLRRSLDGLIAGTRALGQGDLRHRIVVDTRDELSEVARHFNDMSGEMERVMKTVIGDMARLRQAATQLNTLADSVSGQAQKQSDSASAMAAAVEQMAVSVGEISRHAAHTEAVSQSARQQANEGAGQAGEVSSSMQRIAEVVSGCAQSVQELGERSREIGQLIGEIREIADQTNLLALNAAIEAARAGEHGRGFAVVADEVRKLAERSAKSSELIVRTVEAIRGGTQAAVDAMQNGVAEVEDGVRMTGSTTQCLQAIRGRADEVLGSVADIGIALREQNTANEDVARNVEDIARMAESSAQAIRQAADTARELERMADDLTREVGRFRVA